MLLEKTNIKTNGLSKIHYILMLAIGYITLIEGN